MKSYNPFKMWGSYVGGFILFDLVGVFQICLFTCYPYGFLGTTEIYRKLLLHFPLGALFILMFFVIGFLIGWGIHSIFRKMRKR